MGWYHKEWKHCMLNGKGFDVGGLDICAGMGLEKDSAQNGCRKLSIRDFTKDRGRAGNQQLAVRGRGNLAFQGWIDQD